MVPWTLCISKHVRCNVKQNYYLSRHDISVTEPPSSRQLHTGIWRKDGFDFVAALKRDGRLASIPVVALTASGSDETRRRALAVGFVAYLVKPGSLEQLLSVIAQNLRR